MSCFAFLQGNTPEKLAADACLWYGRGFEVIYVKVGMGFERDVACVAAVREAVREAARVQFQSLKQW